MTVHKGKTFTRSEVLFQNYN